MEKREESLREALAKNAEEIERWELYKKENETAIENLQEFSKHLTVDVMVPVGKKCFMPGQLIHTNEVLVGHYQGYFSKCTAYKAKEICDLRIKNAKDQLQKLKTEEDFWTNKLKIPYLEGVVPSTEEREIIEDYDEETEQRWREEHRRNVRLSKLKEKAARENLKTPVHPSTSETLNAEKSDEDLFRMLEEAELMEELEKELENLEINEMNDETLKKLMSGEMDVTKPKQRIAHEAKVNTPELSHVIKKNNNNATNVTKQPATNNNNTPNPALSEHYLGRNVDLTEEVRVIKDQARFLPISDQVGFYEYQVEIVRKKIDNLKLSNEDEMEEKLHLFTVLEELEDLLALAEEESIETDNESESAISDEKIDTIKVEKKEETNTKKRNIKFALQNETLVFRHNEAVSEMLPKTLESDKPKRDIITLDDDNVQITDVVETQAPQKSKKELITEKVEKNLQYVAKDSDLITKIIEETEARTIYIPFKHSTENEAIKAQCNTTTTNDLETTDFIPQKPSDFYDLYLKQLEKEAAATNVSKPFFVNGYDGEDEVKAPILKETDRDVCYEDPKVKYSLPVTENVKTKPILRNKSAVERETHLDKNFTKKTGNKKQKKIDFNEDEIMSAYNKVMFDVVEKPLTEPEPLPDVKFVDAHAPKKRVSRFKQSRQLNDNATT